MVGLVLDDEEAVAIAVGLQTAAQGGIAGIAETSVRALGKVAEALTIHAALEEQYFYPFARQQGVDGLIDESFQDHAEVKRLLSEILQMKQTDPGLEGLCLRLERMVTEHVSQEESALLPKVQSLANEEDLLGVASLVLGLPVTATSAGVALSWWVRSLVAVAAVVGDEVWIVR